MSDDVERGQEREAIDRELALQQHAHRQSMRLRNPTPGTCMDCEEPIEAQRLTVLSHDIAACAECARRNEQKAKHHAR